MVIVSDIFKTNKGRHVWDRQTICEVHRQLYDFLVLMAQDKPELLVKVIPLLEKAYVMGIKMTKQLVEYKMSLPDWEAHESKEEVTRIRQLRKDLEDAISVSVRPAVPQAKA